MPSEFRDNRALARRDRNVWAELYDRHVNTVFGLIYHLVGQDRAVAEDVHQEVWLLAIEQIENFDPAKGDFRAWVLGIARHRALRRRRRAAESTVESVTTSPGDALAPPQHVENEERAGLVRAALLSMSEDRRQVLHQKYTEGLSVAEIAIQSGRSSKAVESLLSRAREQIRELLKPHLSHPVEG
jgi:RNA polymerase sigma-70 factor (ECF subfamily)